MKDIEQSMLHMMKESAKAPATALEHWQAFSAAVDWTENWIRALLACHVILFSVVIFTRKSADAQTFLFLLVCALIFISEYLNSYCSSNWQQFSKQDYFDKNGVFAATVYSGPLLIIALLQLVSALPLFARLYWTHRSGIVHFSPQINFLGLSSSALIKAKRLELKHKRKQQDKDAQADVDKGKEGASFLTSDADKTK